MFLLVVAVFAQTIHYTVAIKRLNPNRVCAAILTSVWQFPLLSYTVTTPGITFAITILVLVLHCASFTLAALECKIIIRKRKAAGAALLLLPLIGLLALTLVLIVHLLAVTAAITATVAANTDA